jgi:transcriptional regulator with XRE-family HTH domain
MDKPNALGEYLRARRDRVRPEEVEIATGGLRRVPGLRREELARLAGISADYYLRLERGRESNPSAQVLDALARALRLDARAAAHLHRLARPQRYDAECAVEHVPNGISQMADQLTMPAMVSGRYQDVLFANAPARTLSPDFRPGHNFLRHVFLEPAARDLHLDWEDVTSGLVGGLREIGGRHSDDPQLHALIDELCCRSERFRTLWELADIGYRRDGTNHMQHPLVGELHLHRSKLDIPHSRGQHLLILHAEPATQTAQALARLRELTIADRSGNGTPT